MFGWLRRLDERALRLQQIGRDVVWEVAAKVFVVTVVGGALAYEVVVALLGLIVRVLPGAYVTGLSW